MIITAPSALIKGIRALFTVAVTGVERAAYASRIAELVPSTGKSEQYAWLGEPAQMSQVDDEVKFDGVTDTNYTLTNVLFASGLIIKRTEVEDDQIAAIRGKVTRLATVAATHPNSLVISALTSNGTDYTGNSFFSSHAARKDEGGAQTNLVTLTGVTVATFQADLASALASINTKKAENGEPFNEAQMSFAIVAPVAHQFNMETALTAGVISQTENVQFRNYTFDRIYTPRLTGNTWYLLGMTPGFEALILQERVRLTFESLMTGEAALRQEQYKFKARARRVAGYKFWQSAARIA